MAVAAIPFICYGPCARICSGGIGSLSPVEKTTSLYVSAIYSVEYSQVGNINESSSRYGLFSHKGTVNPDLSPLSLSVTRGVAHPTNPGYRAASASCPFGISSDQIYR